MQTKLNKTILLVILISVWVYLPKFQKNLGGNNEKLEAAADFFHILFVRLPIGVTMLLIGLIAILATHVDEGKQLRSGAIV